jgi:hypothetical protein
MIANLPYLVALLLIVTATHGKIIGRNFALEAYGVLESQNLTFNVTSSAMCGLACTKRRICTMFSLTEDRKPNNNQEKNYICKLSYGATAWTPLANRTTSIFVGKRLFYCVHCKMSKF